MLFIMRGASCSGKDSFIKKNFTDHTVLSSDWYRKVLTNDESNQQQNGLVFDTMRQILEIRLKNRVPYTVINATNLKMKSISEFMVLARKFGEKVTVISIDPPTVEELHRRSCGRSENGGLYVPLEVLQRHHDSYFNSLVGFEKYAQDNSDSFSFVRIDQDYNIL